MEAIKYQHYEATHNLEAPSVVVPILIKMFNPKSVVDVGCGTGTWLKCFYDHHITDILGLDGQNVDQGALLIDKKFFHATDLRLDWRVNRLFDLTICLEVAEHLPESNADKFIDNLSSLSDTIVFSAAIPGQGGQNHLNEQWLSYWIAKFESRGYAFYDVIRPLIWNDKHVNFWYQQNIVVFSKRTLDFQSSPFSDLVHPKLLLMKDHEINVLKSQLKPSLINAAKILYRALFR